MQCSDKIVISFLINKLDWVPCRSFLSVSNIVARLYALVTVRCFASRVDKDPSLEGVLDFELSERCSPKGAQILNLRDWNSREPLLFSN